MFERTDAPFPSVPALNPAPRRPPGFWEGVGAGFRSEAIETDWYQRRARDEQSFVDEVRSRLTPEEMPEPVTGRMTSHKRARAERAAVLEAARMAAETDPARFGDLPLTEENVGKAAVERAKEEHADAQETLGFMSGGRRVAAEFLGRGGAAISDPTSLLLMAVPGGSALRLSRLVVREAALGALGEALVMPRRFEVADELDLQEPNILADLGLGAAFGGALGAGVPAIFRGVTYARERLGRVPEGRTERDLPEIDALEERLETPDFTSSPPPPARQATRADLDVLRSVRDEIDQEVRAAYGGQSRPLVSALRRAGIQIDPDGPAGQELKARGVTARSVPGLYAPGGLYDVDNLDPDAIGVPLPRDGDYLSRDAILEGVEAEASGRRAFSDDLTVRLDEAEAEIERLERAMDTEEPTFEPVRADSAQARRAAEDEIEADLGRYARDTMMAVEPGDIRAAARQLAAEGGAASAALNDAVARREAWLPEYGSEFDDGASSPGVEPIKRQADEDLRMAVEEDDFEVTLPDGRTMRASEVMAEMDADREFVEVAELCNSGGVPF
jgi:hypothetical protein